MDFAPLVNRVETKIFIYLYLLYRAFWYLAWMLPRCLPREEHVYSGHFAADPDTVERWYLSSGLKTSQYCYCWGERDLGIFSRHLSPRKTKCDGWIMDQITIWSDFSVPFKVCSFKHKAAEKWTKGNTATKQTGKYDNTCVMTQQTQTTVNKIRYRPM